MALASALQLSCGLGVVATGGTSGTGFSQGPITDFGSIVVGDITWNVEGAEIVFDGVMLPPDALPSENEADLVFDVGQVVAVEGSIAPGARTGNATRISFDDAVEGPINADPVVVGPGERELIVLGQRVIIDADPTQTFYVNGASFAGLARNDVIEVSGLVDGDVIYATWVNLVGPFQAGVSRGELRGIVTDLSIEPDEVEFEIGSATVVFDPNTVEFVGFEGMPLVEGMLVEAVGILADVEELEATSIELEPVGLAIENADSIELNGIVANFVDASTPFTVSGVTVDPSDAEIVGVLVDGVEVEVEGELVNGVILAEEIEVEDD